MSGQYPPPNPINPNPYNRPSLLQRTPSAWSSTSQPSGLNAVGSSLNFYGSPHLGMPSRVPQPWARAGNPNALFGMQRTMSPEESQRIPSEYQQEETMDLSTTVQDVPKVLSARSVSNDFIKNGAILSSSEVNGDVARTKTEVNDSVTSSVIATNPEYSTDPLYCSKDEDSVLKRDVNLSRESSSSNSDMTNFKQSTSSQEGNEMCLNKPPMNLTEQTEPLQNPTKPIPTQNWNKPACSSLSDANSARNEVKDVHDFQMQNDHIGNSSQLQSSYLDSSALSVDTDESRLVVAESSADDIFGISPVEDFTSQTSRIDHLENLASACSAAPEKPLDQDSCVFTGSGELPSESSSTTGNSAGKDAEPHPSVENVETLLENMFNSQEETCCSSQNNALAAPPSVIVSNGMKTPESSNPQVDLITPMKEEELAKTLSEDSFVDSQLKDSKPHERVIKNLNNIQPTDDEVKLSLKNQQSSNDIKEDPDKENFTDQLMKEIEEKLEKLTEPNLDLNRDKINPPEPSSSVPLKDEPIKVEVGLNEKNDTPALVFNRGDNKIADLNNAAPSALPEIKSEVSSSSNPFIEVENELEKMFAGIVEPADETGTGSDNQSQRSVSETKSHRVIRKTAVKRKRPNSRRASDNSVFGGASSGESTPVKRGRKRKSESGSERSSTKVKTFNEESLKKGRYKDIASDVSGGKLKGPFIRVEGSKESPASVVVVNSGTRVDDEEGTDKNNARRKHSKKQRSEGAEVTRRAGPAYSSSTLSARYNSDQADLSWVCVFCQRGPHCTGGISGGPAGDLFGPYRVPQSQLLGDSPPHDTPSDREVVDEQKRRGGKLPKSLRASGCAEQFIQRMARKGKRASSTETALAAVGGEGLEVWLHGACAQWAPGLCVIGAQLVGLDDAVSTALRSKCCQCGSTGAGLGCVVRNCPARVHYHCASLSGWLLNSDTFIARCQSHRTRPRP